MKAGNNPEIARVGQKVTKSISRVPMVVETWFTPQNDLKSWFSGSMQADYNHKTTGSSPKMHFSDFGGPYMVKFLTFSIFKKPFDVWNWLTPTAW